MLRRCVTQHACSGNALWATTAAASLTTRCNHTGPAPFLHPSLRRLSRQGVPPTARVYPTVRALHTVTTAANFDAEVIQSQQAICAVYYIPNSSSCSAYLASAEKLVDELNAEAAGMFDVPDEATAAARTEASEAGVLVDASAGNVASNQPQGAVVSDVDFGSGASAHGGGDGKKTNHWLKLCIINADENRNLASAFSVERAKLPMTYFVMQGTIIDKVVGHISQLRLKSILYNFLAHYQKEMNVDLMARGSSQYNTTSGSASPLPTAQKVDLLQAGASTSYLKDKILASLVGSERISLPEESEHLDGLRKLVQDGKKKAHGELQDLYRKLGMDVRRLSDAEMHQHYYQSKQFATVGVISALEALFLAREYASIGDISRDNVEWARRAVQKDFEPILGHAEVRKVLALVEAVTLRGDLTQSMRAATIEMQGVVSSMQAMEEQAGAAAAPTPASSSFMQQRFHAAQEQHDFLQRLIKVIDEHVDARVLDEEFPSATVDALFADLKAGIQQVNQWKRQKQQQQQQQHRSDVAIASAEERVQQLKIVLMCIMQMHPTDAKSQMARSRLSSLMF